MYRDVQYADAAGANICSDKLLRTVGYLWHRTLGRIRAMSGNSFGRLFTVTSFGESHGVAIGCVVDGCPPGMALTEEDIQPDLDRRKPGKSRHTTQRRESDAVRILPWESR